MQRRPGKTARQRAELRGLVFRPLNPMPELILRAQSAHANQRIEMRKALRAAREKAALNTLGEPLLDAERVWNYGRQNRNVYRPLTPRQQRRRVHKARKHQFPNLGILEAHRAALAR